MCNQSCLDLTVKNLRENEVRDKSVIEVGALNVNGSLRPMIEKFHPKNYVGVDIEMGPGVDRVCAAEDLIITFGVGNFDVVICTELLEHVRDWRVVMHNLKGILKPGGILLITTRSIGFDYHGFPYDFWRYEKSDMEFIFSDFELQALESDPSAPGVFVKAKRPIQCVEKSLEGHKLYSILQNRRSSVSMNIFYGSVVCSPLVKMFKSKDRVARIMYYNAFPEKIPGLLAKKLSAIFRSEK